jgi:hypothetical protein
VPGLRAWMRKGVPRAWAGVAAFTLALSGGVGAVVLCAGFRELSVAQLVVAPGASDPPLWVLAGPLVLGLGVAVGPAWLARRFTHVAEAIWLGRLSLVATFASAAIVVYWSWDPVTDGLDGSWWQETVAWAALVAAPGAGFVYFVVWPALRGRLRRL